MNSGSLGISLTSGYFLVLCRTLNSDINTNMTSLGSKIDTHDASIKSTITTSQNTITNAINGVKNDITEQGTTLKNVINTKGCVKSVQRGTKSAFTLKYDEITRIDITNVNLDKSILLLDCQMSGDGAPIFNLLSNAIVITNSNNNPTNTSYIHGISYQVVEFY